MKDNKLKEYSALLAKYETGPTSTELAESYQNVILTFDLINQYYARK